MEKRAILLILVLLGCAAPVENTPPVEPTVRAVNSTHQIFMNGQDGSGWRCTSVAVSNTNLLTARHCVEGRDNVRVYIAEKNRPADVVFMSDERDLAEVKLKDYEMADWVDLGPQPRYSQHVTFMGYGCMGTLQVSEGRVLLYTDTQNVVFPSILCHGDSGGPLFNDDFELVGIANSTSNSLWGRVSKFARVD